MPSFRILTFAASCILGASCTGTDAPPTSLPDLYEGAPRASTIIAVVLEPGVCFGCSSPPASLVQLEKCAPTVVHRVWRRAPRDSEARIAAPLRLDVRGTLVTPFPKRPPSGPTYLFYRLGKLHAVAHHTEQRVTDSLVLGIASELELHCDDTTTTVT